jgi:hypothetical protein
VLSLSLGWISCGSSSTTTSDATATNAFDTGPTNAFDTGPANVVDAAPASVVDTAPASVVDTAPTNTIDATPTSNGIDASIADAIDTGLTTGDIDAGRNDSCPNLAGAYILTTQIVSTTCKLGLNTVTQPITYTFKQTAPSCSFTMTASIYPSSTYTGHFVMAGGKAKVFWDSVSPAPSILTYALTYTGEDLAIMPGATAATSTIAGTFTWHSAADCDGTTNVCSGALPAGCPTPK